MKKSWSSKIFGNVAKFFGKEKEEEGGYEEACEHEIPRKLYDKFRRSHRDMELFIDNMNDSVKEFIGSWVADGGGVGGWRGWSGWHVFGNRSTNNHVPVNKLQEMVRLYMRLLASNRPQVMIDTEYQDLRPFAYTFELAINRHLNDIKIEEDLYDAVLNAMFGWGCIKTGLAKGSKDEEFEYEGAVYDPGSVFSRSVRPENFVIDVSARSINEISYVGDRYKMPEYWVAAMCEENGVSYTPTKGENGFNHPERPIGLERDIDTSDEPRGLYKEVECWDIYLPKQGLMCMYVEGKDKPLYVSKWEGPENHLGPYHVLGFQWVPGEVMPLPPTQIIKDLHKFVNSLTRKIERQARRQKTVIAIDRADEEDAKTLRDANDGEIIGVNQLGAAAEMSFGGPDMANQQINLWGIDTFNSMAGGLQTLSGTEPMAETFKQDELLHNTASEVVNEMRRAVIKFVREVVRDHAWYLWTDPIHEINVNKVIEGTGISIPAKFSDEEKKGKFIDYNFDINVHSLKEKTPEEETQKLMMVWNATVAPNAEILMQQGKMPNIAEFTRQICDLQGIPYENMIMDMDPESVAQNEKPGMQEAPARFRRFETVNTRVSKPGTTQKGNLNAQTSAAAETASAQQGGVKQIGGGY